MIVRRKRIQQIVNQLLQEEHITHPPVSVLEIAKKRGIAVRTEKIPGSNISGFLFKRGNKLVIGINSSHQRTRQRFTIAHELGHALLHRSNLDEFHVDRGLELKFRDRKSSQGTDIEEREANYFAATLLMPEQFIATDLARVGHVDLEDDEVISKLANRYVVSNQAFQIRLSNLGYLKF